MNTKQIQFNRQKVAALVLAGSILAAGLVWAGASSSTVQPASVVHGCADSPQPGHPGLSAGVDCPQADLAGDESELWPWSQLRTVKGGRPTGGGGGDIHK